PLLALQSEQHQRQLVAFGYTVHRTPVEHCTPPLCLVPGGPFLMGRNPQQDRVADPAAALPRTQVELEAISIAMYPVTVMEYAACGLAAGHDPPPPELRDPLKGHISWSAQQEKPFHPVAMVSWHDGLAYADWLAHLTGQPWRLPTEAEWEKAARWDERAQQA